MIDDDAADASHAKNGAFVSCAHLTCGAFFHPTCALFCDRVKLNVKVELGVFEDEVNTGSADVGMGKRDEESFKHEDKRTRIGIEFCCEGIHEPEVSLTLVLGLL